MLGNHLSFSALALGALTMSITPPAFSDPLPPITQWTFSPRGHDLDNNDNFAPDGRYVLFDARETIGPAIEHCTSIGMLDTRTKEELPLYEITAYQTGAQAAPGVGAASFSPDGSNLIFIHGPLLHEVAERGPYAKPNRRGALVYRDRPGEVHWLDARDVATDHDTTPGAHRGGTHRHEYSRNGQRIGFTYDDFLLPHYDRTIGYLEAHPNAPEGVSHWFAVIVPVVPKGTAKPGEIERAWGDSWVNAEGTLRAFIGQVREADGSYQQSLFVADIPTSVDITTANAGGPDRYPTPPAGITVRRLTQGWAEGVVRGSHDGTRVAYYGKDAHGKQQLFVVPADGSAPPRQVTNLPTEVVGIDGGLRWHPSGQFLFGITSGDIFVVSLREDDFGRATLLTSGGEYAKLAVSPDGGTLYFCGPDPRGVSDPAYQNYAGKPYWQIFSIPFQLPAV
jgi:hypothetical protein